MLSFCPSAAVNRLAHLHVAGEPELANSAMQKLYDLNLLLGHICAMWQAYLFRGLSQ